MRRSPLSDTPALRRVMVLAAIALGAVGTLVAVAIGWEAAGPLTSPPPTTAAQTTTAPASPAPSASPSPTPAPAPAGRMWSVLVTFYASGDNDPPGSTDIAFPNGHHPVAGGTGTYADPLSLAADPRAIAVGTRVYYPALQKYFVMEDTCAACIAEWRSSRTPHVDLWLGDHVGAGSLACEDQLTPDGRVPVEVDPPPGRPVDTHPLYTGRACAPH